MDDLGGRTNTPIQRLLRLIDSARERLGERNASFAGEFAEIGEWELAIETITEESRHRLVLSPAERDELAAIERSLRRLQPRLRWLSVRDLVRGIVNEGITAARRRR